MQIWFPGLTPVGETDRIAYAEHTIIVDPVDDVAVLFQGLAYPVGQFRLVFRL